MVNTPRGSRDRLPHHGAPASGPRNFEIKATGAAAKAYDFKAARLAIDPPDHKTTNVLESIGHLVKGCLGAGFVAIHESYKQNGLLSSVIINLISGFLVAYCMFILLRSAQKMYGRVQEPRMSYPDLAEAALKTSPFPKLQRLSKCFRYAVDVTITVDLFGSCCVYQVVIARSIKQLVEGVETVKDAALGSSPNIRVYILCLLVPCILLCLIRSLKYLAPFSIVADVFILIVAVATIYYAILSVETSPFDFPNFKTVEGFFLFLGACVFSMEGVGVSMAIENNMTNPKKYPLVIIGGMSIVVGLVTIVGFFGYWGFGEQSKSPLTLNFPFGPFPYILKILMVLMIIVTFALNFWVPFDLVWYYLKKRYPPEKYWLWERVYRAIFVTGITLIAVCFPNVSSFIGLLGSMCLANMGFIYPAFIELCLDWDDPGLGFMKWRLIKWMLIIIFGIVLCICGTYSSGKQLIESVFFEDT